MIDRRVLCLDVGLQRRFAARQATSPWPLRSAPTEASSDDPQPPPRDRLPDALAAIARRPAPGRCPAEAPRCRRLGREIEHDRRELPRSETAPCALPLSARRMPESGRSGRSRRTRWDEVLECEGDADPVLVRLCVAGLKRRSAPAGRPEAQVRAVHRREKRFSSASRAQGVRGSGPAQSAPARKTDVLQDSADPPLLRGRQKIGECRRTSGSARPSGRPRKPMLPSGAGPESKWRERIDPPDRDPALEQQRRRAETNLDLGQFAQQPTIEIAHAHAYRAEVERMILAQAQLRLVDVDRRLAASSVSRYGVSQATETGPGQRARRKSQAPARPPLPAVAGRHQQLRDAEDQWPSDGWLRQSGQIG